MKCTVCREPLPEPQNGELELNLLGKKRIVCGPSGGVRVWECPACDTKEHAVVDFAGLVRAIVNNITTKAKVFTYHVGVGWKGTK